MSIKLSCFNMKGLRHRSKASLLLRGILSFSLDVAAIADTLFVCDVDARMLAREFVVYSTHRDQQARGVSLLEKRTLGVRVDLLHVDADGRLILADVAVKSS